MQLYYTGASKIGDPQLIASSSLGGIVSISPIPNDSIGNIFSEATIYAVQSSARETKLIALKNTTVATVNNIIITPTFDLSDLYDYRIAFAGLLGNSANQTFEKIANAKDLPYYASFIDLVSGTPLSLSPSSLAVNALIGIWITRTLKKPAPLDCADYTEQSQNSFTEEKLSLQISWN